jgi:hypothetical protein
MALSCSFKNNETGQKLTTPASSKISIFIFTMKKSSRYFNSYSEGATTGF